MAPLPAPFTPFPVPVVHEERFRPKVALRGRPFGRLRVLSLDDAANAPPRHYLLRGIIAPGELSLWWGQPKCGKSFLLLRLAYGLALGVGMWCRSAKRCRVLYVAAEGEGGFAARLLALRDAMGDAEDAFAYIAQRAVVGPPSGDLSDVIAAAVDLRADVIVLDTVARTFGDGDENAAKDMGGFVASVDRLREETGAHVAVIHHGTKDGNSARGSSALVGAADLIVKIAKGGESGPSVAVIEAAKDDVDGAELPFILQSIELPPGEDGEARQTCVATETRADRARRKELPRVAREALGTLATLILSEGEMVPPDAKAPLATKGLREDRWRDECDERRLSLADEKKDRDRVFRRAAKDLRDAGEVAIRSGWVWLLKVAEGASDAKA